MISWFTNSEVTIFSGTQAIIHFPNAPISSPENIEFMNEFRGIFNMVSGDLI